MSVLDLNTFPILAQAFIEKTYLRVLNGSEKPNSKDGFIEREIHGAMHGGRASIYVDIFDKIVSSHFPEYVNDGLNGLGQELGYTKQELLLLTRYAALGHDAGRRGENEDSWENESGDQIYEFLKSENIPPEKARLFADLAVYKDKPDELTKKYANLPPSAMNGAHYLRKLIAMSDCVDIIRCAYPFKYNELLKHVKDIPGYNQAHHESMFKELADEVFYLLRDMGDLRFASTLPSEPYTEILQKKTHAYSLRKKVTFEHSDNVILTILKCMGENQYFQSFIPPTSTIPLHAPPLMYNPYLHGTTSNILPLLVHSDFQLMSPIDMLSEYQLAPLSGELTRGGLEHPDAKCYPCFGQLYAPYSAYTLKDVIAYTKDNPNEIVLDKLKQSIQSTIQFGNRSLFYYINYLLIDVARYRMLGGNLSEIEGIQNLPQVIQACVSMLYLHLLFTSYTVADPSTFSTATTTTEWWGEQLPTCVSEETVLNFILSNNLNLADAYQNYSKEKWQAILDTMPFFVDKLSNVFQATKAPFQPPVKGCSNQWLNKIKNSGEYEYRWLALLYSLAMHTDGQDRDLLNSGYSSAIVNRILNYINSISKHAESLDKILKQPDSYYQQLLSDLPTHPSFPIILVYESADDVSVYGHSKLEFRVNHSLKFGEDIKTVATTQEHQEELQQFFSNYHIQVNVITIEELKQKEQVLLSRFEASPPLKIGALEQAQGMTFFQAAAAPDLTSSVTIGGAQIPTHENMLPIS